MYRTARSTKTPDTILTCRVCATTTSFAFESHGTFTCEACGREQPVLRALDDLKMLETKVVRREDSTVYSELGPFVQELTGKNDAAKQVDVKCDGMEVLVALSFNSGTVMGVDLVVLVPSGELPFPLMNLLPEDGSHRKAKEKGLSREAQTGDDEFDDAVYIESALTDESVRRFLSPPAVRKAVIRLVRDTPQIQISPEKITLHIPKDKAFEPTLLRERLTCLRILAGAPRLIYAEIVPESRLVRMTKLVSVLLAPTGLGLGLFGWIGYGPMGVKPYFFCIALGIALTLLARPILARIFRGRSTSHTDLMIHTILGMFFNPLLMMGILFPSNAWFATSKDRTVEMRVKDTNEDDDDHSKLHVNAIDPDDPTTRTAISFTPPPNRPASLSSSRIGAKAP
jgi:hypothetical protein